MSALLFSLYLLVLAAELCLEWLNLRHLRQRAGEMPAAFAGAIDPQLLRRGEEYTVATTRLGLVETLAGGLAMAVFLFGGLLPLYDRWVSALSDSFVFGGVLFFWGVLLARLLLGLPFRLYHTFGLEARHGFNTTTPRLWLADLAKSTLLSLLLSGLLAAGAFWLVSRTPQLWWLWIWLLFALFTALLMYVSPYLIEPLFFKFEPVRRPGLEEELRAMTQKTGVAVSRVLQVDASRRSRHSNAYFTGLGRVKRIVLFDTLLEQMSDGEILAVLAHELGHWKRHHILKRLLAAELLFLAAFYLAFRLIEGGGLPPLLGMAEASFAAQVVILSFLAGLAGFPFTPLGSWLSRRHEWQADRFASDLTGHPDQLASALIKLGRENLANLHPHPFYAWFHYSHPPLVERVERLLAQRSRTS
ncbi:MAG: M48 family metallopeptidase [Desulfuromonadales bacterium]|nr:M48 family metallopeptidase [Desulfuromonadales bacterium]